MTLFPGIKNYIETSRVREDDLQDEIDYLSEENAELRRKLDGISSPTVERVTLKELYEPEKSEMIERIESEAIHYHKSLYERRFNNVRIILESLVAGYNPMEYGELNHKVRNLLSGLRRELEEKND